MTNDHLLYLTVLAQTLNNAKRVGIGGTVDIPEGQQFIMMSDTLARLIVTKLKEIIKDA